MCTMSCEGPIDCGAGELWVCEREMQCRSLGNIIPYNGYKTSVIVHSRETFISDEGDDCTWHYRHGLRFR